MNVTVNGEDTSLEGVKTVAELLRGCGLRGRPCAVEVNAEVVPRAAHGERVLREGDRVEIVTLVGGG